MARITPVDYRGKVWCVQVPTGAFVARRNGKVFVTGNSGFPKSLDVSKAIDKAAGAKWERIRGVRSGVVKEVYAQDAWSKEFKDSVLSSEPITDAAATWQGYGTALKPAYEPIIVARKPLNGTVAANCQEHGCGALNIDGTRIGFASEEDKAAAAAARRSCQDKNKGRNAYAEFSNGPASLAPYLAGMDKGRWPANVIHDGSEEVLAGFPQSQPGAWPAKRGVGGISTNGHTGHETGVRIESSEGSAARFFYCAKASKSDRGEGNTHPTVKPLKLMEYLVKLVTMPGENRILDPFAGSGTTLLACDNAGIPCVGVELEAEHVEIINARRGANTKNYLFN